MRKISWILLSVFCVLSILLLPAFVSADDCGGSWRTLKNYKKGSGGPCKAMGLNSRAGTCRPGDTHVTLCDDRKGGQFRTCKGQRRCDNIHIIDDQTIRDCKTWDFQYNQPCPVGFYNSDCQGGCEKKGMILIGPSTTEEPSGLK